MNFLSTGGLGDAFIVALKIKEMELDKGFTWTHVESNNIEKPFFELLSFFDFKDGVRFIHDPDYIANIKIHKENKKVIPVPVNDFCRFHKNKHVLENPFLDRDRDEVNEVVLQCSGGTNNDRSWPIDPLLVAKAIQAKGHQVIIVGNDKRYELNEPGNLVGKTSLTVALEIIERCKVFVGLSGLLSFFAMASKVKTIHYEISPEINEHYIHKDWHPYMKNIKFGSLTEILKELR